MKIEYIPAKTIISKGKPNEYYLLFDYVMNIYRGCDHGCIYCYARSEFYEKSNNFDNIRAKKNALQIVRDELRRKVKKGVVLTGGVSDPYNKFEKDLNLTHNALELINAYEFGANIITKSDLVLRDIDILCDIKEHSPAIVNFTITCLGDDMCSKIEPYVALSSQRFKAIQTLTKTGIVTGVLMDPIIPYLTDTEENVIEIVKKAKNYGAKYIHMSPLVTLADVQRDYFYEKAEQICNGISEKYKKRFKNNYRCFSPKHVKLWNIFEECCNKEGISCNLRESNSLIMQAYGDRQLKFDI